MKRWFFCYDFVDRFVAQLLDDAPPMARSPLPSPSSSGRRKKIDKYDRQMDSLVKRLVARATDFQAKEKLNFYQRARLAHRLQNGLLAKGYPLEVARSVATGISGIS